MVSNLSPEIMSKMTNFKVYENKLFLYGNYVVDTKDYKLTNLCKYFV